MKTIILLLLTFFFFSCTITKRTFRSGYHIEWNHKFKQSTTQKQPESSIKEGLSSLSDKPIDKPTNDERLSSITSEKPNVIVETTSVESMEHQNRTVFEKNIVLTRQDAAKSLSDSPKDQLAEHHKKTVEPVSWFALFFSLSNSVLRILIFLQIVDSFFLPLAAIFFVLTIVLAFVSLERYRKNRSKYYVPWLALSAIWIETFVWAMISLIIALQALGNMLGNIVATFFKGMN